MTPPGLLFAVSGHGFGHATRCAAVIAALVARGLPPERITVRSEAPAWIFTGRVPGVRVAPAAIDPGVLQPNGLDLDLPGTLAAHLAFTHAWEDRLAREAAFIESSGAALVVGDVPPLSFAAAARAGVPAVAMANFSWDWILEAYALDEPRWAPIIDRYRGAYGEAGTLYRLPLHGDLSAFREIVDVPFVVNRATRSREACRASIGVGPAEGRKLVLVSFGGFGSGPFGASEAEDLSPYLFVGTGPRPPGFAGEWIALPSPSKEPHEDLVLACDAIVGKPGYSTVAEAIAHEARFVYLTREGFREVPELEAGLARHACARPMPRGAFESGHWREHLDALFLAPAPSRNVACDGAERVAAALLDRLAS